MTAVSVGTCAAQGERVTFWRFMRIGLPITAVQLSLGDVCGLALAWAVHEEGL
jgi:hypothetical protein